MEPSVQGSGRFTWYIPTPSISRAIALAYTAILLGLFVGIPLHILGPRRIIGSFYDDALLWLCLISGFGCLIGFFLLLAFPPRSWRARLEFGRDYVRFIPVPILRWIGEPAAEKPLGQDLKETLICEGRQEKSPYGFRVLLRGVQGPDSVLAVPIPVRLSAHESRRLTNGIIAATGLPTRLVRRVANEGGTVQEIPWTPTGQSSLLAGFAKLIPAASPIIGGIVVGYLRPNPAIVVITGIALWLSETIGLFLYAHFSHQRSKYAALLWLTTLITFSAAYAATFAVVAYMFHKG